MPLRFHTLLIFLLFPLFCFSQTVINAIEFEGNKKTDIRYLNRFLDSAVDSIFDTSMAESDLQRLRNLNCITNAEFRIDSSENEHTLVFEITEAFTIFPIINFGGVENNFWFQVGATDLNFLGKGIQFSASYQNIDRRNNYSLYTKIPYLNGSRWGTSFSFLRFASTEPLYFGDETVFYDYNNTSFGLTGFYELNRQQFISLGATFFNEKYGKNDRHQNEQTAGPPGLELPKLLVRLQHQINRLDYDYFQLAGFDNKLQFQTVQNFDDNPLFLIFINDTRYFKRTGLNGNLALRIRLGISSNDNTPFAPFVLDNFVNIRGSGNRVDRGTAAAILNAEYRQTIWSREQFAAQVVAFSDAGTWRNPGGQLSDLTDADNFRHFVGGGFRFIYKNAFNAILRIDYGFDVYDRQENGFVLGLGQYF